MGWNQYHIGTNIYHLHPSTSIFIYLPTLPTNLYNPIYYLSMLIVYIDVYQPAYNIQDQAPGQTRPKKGR